MGIMAGESRIPRNACLCILYGYDMSHTIRRFNTINMTISRNVIMFRPKLSKEYSRDV